MKARHPKRRTIRSKTSTKMPVQYFSSFHYPSLAPLPVYIFLPRPPSPRLDTFTCFCYYVTATTPSTVLKEAEDLKKEKESRNSDGRRYVSLASSNLQNAEQVCSSWSVDSSPLFCFCLSIYLSFFCLWFPLFLPGLFRLNFSFLSSIPVPTSVSMSSR